MSLCSDLKELFTGIDNGLCGIRIIHCNTIVPDMHISIQLPF